MTNREALDMVIKALSQQRTGHWIEERTHMECPNCHDIWHYEENQTERFKFCPTCGYRMIEPQERSDRE